MWLQTSGEETAHCPLTHAHTHTCLSIFVWSHWLTAIYLQFFCPDLDPSAQRDWRWAPTSRSTKTPHFTMRRGFLEKWRVTKIFPLKIIKELTCPQSGGFRFLSVSWDLNTQNITHNTLSAVLLIITSMIGFQIGLCYLIVYYIISSLKTSKCDCDSCYFV